MTAAVPDHARRLWRTLAGRDDVLAPGTRAVVHAARGFCPPGWVGVVRLGDAIVVEAGEATPEHLDVLLALDDPADPAAVAASLAPAETLGPGELAYVPDTAAPRPEDPPPDLLLERRPVDELSTWFATLPPHALEESDVAEMADVVVAVRDDELLGAAGHTDWPADIAHLGIVVHPSAQGLGVGRILAAAATTHALRLGRHPQWRAATWNAASRAVARRVGYVEVGRQFSFRFAPSEARCS